MNPLVARLEKWVLTYRQIGSGPKADVLGAAIAALKAGRRSADAIAQLHVVALVSEADPNQSSAAALMREAADAIEALPE